MVERIQTQTVLLFLVICVQLYCVSSDATKACSVMTQRPHPQGLCGNKISRVLQLLCGESGYNQKKYKKRSAIQGSPNDLSPFYQNFYGKEEANSFLAKRVEFYQTGISCECCYNKCSVPELVTYCNGGKAKGLETIQLLLNKDARGFPL
ncbi:hypothetical protein ACJMK2_025416 [Sinanodonta woodiana]|uniref:Insulin-like domain-containing protein n=1 Tax=Sinanodonta woodiana TaxID=1069815 RepID=A0ABD3XHY6_SINWO